LKNNKKRDNSNWRITGGGSGYKKSRASVWEK